MHIYFLIGFRSRLVVALSWAWSYLTFERGTRLITGSDGAAEPRAAAKDQACATRPERNADTAVEPRDLDAWAAMRHALWPDADAVELARECAAFFAEPHLIDAVFRRGVAGDGTLVGFVELSLRSHADGCSTSPVPYVEGWFVAAGGPAGRRRKCADRSGGTMGIGRRVFGDRLRRAPR